MTLMQDVHLYEGVHELVGGSKLHLFVYLCVCVCDVLVLLHTQDHSAHSTKWGLFYEVRTFCR